MATAGRLISLCRLTCIFCGAIVLAFTTGTPATASIPGQNGRIVFESTAPDPNRVSGGVGIPDTGRSLFTTKPNGNDLRVHWSHGADPSWAPDGVRVAFVSRGSTRIGLIDPALPWGVTGFETGLRSVAAPAWAPDGKSVAFVGYDSSFRSDIYVIDITTSAVTNLTRDAALDLSPSWAPDGARIAFSSNRGGSSSTDIFTMARDGSAVVNLTNSDVNEFDPNWSPGGSLIAFAAGAGSLDLWKMRVDGTGRVRLGGLPGNEADPVWSPAGDFLLFQVEHDGTGDIYRMRADGTGVVNLTSSSHDDRHPDWNSRIPVPILTVNTTDDLDDGFCTSSHCSLREAIGVSNRRPGKDMIDFEILPSGMHTIRPLSELPALTEPTLVDGRTQFGYTTHPLIEIDGSLAGAGADGVTLAGGDSLVQALAINRFSGNGIRIEGSGGSRVHENHLGLDPPGLEARGNAGAGLAILDSANNFVGRRPASDLGLAPRTPGNTLSTTNGPGILIRGSRAVENEIDDNEIGVKAGGGAALAPRTPNPGVVLDGGASSNVVRFNLITGNGDGVVVDGTSTRHNMVQLNDIGRLEQHYSIPGTGGWGLVVRDAPFTQLHANRVRHARAGGIRVSGASAALGDLQGNSVQMGADLSEAGPAGIWVDGTPRLRLRGNSAVSGHVGIRVDSDDNELEGNSAGANRGAGIELRGSRNVLSPIEQESPAFAPYDRITQNGGAGIAVVSGSRNRIMSASLIDNAQLGIDLGSDGLTPNDPVDEDSGPNGLQNFPTLTAAVRNRSDITISGVLHSKPGSTYAIHVAAVERCDPSGHGEADRLLPVREFHVTTDSAGTADFTERIERTQHVGLPKLDDLVTATATDSAGNTSEIGRCIAVSPGGEDRAISVNAPDDVDDGSCTEGHCSLREAIGASNATSGFERIRFALPSGSQTIAPRSPLPKLADSVILDGTSQPSYAGRPIVELDGSQAGSASGITVAAPSSTVKGFVVHSFQGNGIETKEQGVEAHIIGNFIGTDRTGRLDRGNGGHGILVNDYYWMATEPHVIGGSDVSDRNVVSGNEGAGVFMSFGTKARVKGNYIGTEAGGARGLGNSGSGVASRTSGARIGGVDAAAGNVVSGNAGHGIEVASIGLSYPAGSNEILGNLIGTDANGLHAIGNEQDGINVAGSIFNTASRNVISGNRGSGVVAQSDRVVGNLIGTDRTGRVPLGNGAWGVITEAGPVGGTAAGDGNVISANRDGGVLVSLSGDVIGNWIGTDRERNLNLGNGGPGIQRSFTYGCAFNYGWHMKVLSNTIAHNGGPGVLEALRCLLSSNEIASNRIFSNRGLGIELGDDGVTANDVLDVDTGINRLQNFPVITAVGTAAGKTRVDGRLDSEAGGTYTIELFSNDVCDPLGHGEGEVPLASFDIRTDSSGSAVFSRELPEPVPYARRITATATGQEDLQYRLDRFTSEFSPCAQATADLSAALADAPDPAKVGRPLTYTVGVRNSGPSEARGVSTDLSLPKHAGKAAATVDRGTCRLVPGGVRCALGDVEIGGTATVTVRIRPAAKGDLTATARTVAAEPPDPGLENNSAGASTRVEP